MYAGRLRELQQQLQERDSMLRRSDDQNHSRQSQLQGRVTELEQQLQVRIACMYESIHVCMNNELCGCRMPRISWICK